MQVGGSDPPLSRDDTGCGVSRAFLTQAQLSSAASSGGSGGQAGPPFATCQQKCGTDDTIVPFWPEGAGGADRHCCCARNRRPSRHHGTSHRAARLRPAHLLPASRLGVCIEALSGCVNCTHRATMARIAATIVIAALLLTATDAGLAATTVSPSAAATDERRTAAAGGGSTQVGHACSVYCVCSAALDSALRCTSRPKQLFLHSSVCTRRGGCWQATCPLRPCLPAWLLTIGPLGPRLC